MNELKEVILHKINEGSIAMRPRWRFVLSAIAAILGFVFLTFLTVYLVSFVFFMLKVNGAYYATWFGMAGLLTLLMALPWRLLLLAVMLLISLELLVRRFSVVYNKPLVYSLFGILGIVVIGTQAILLSAVHDRINATVTVHHAPVFTRMYRQASASPSRNVFIGMVTAVGTSSATIRDRHRGSFRISPLPQPVKEGELVIIFGDINGDGMIEARGVRVVTAEEVPFQFPCDIEETPCLSR